MDRASRARAWEEKYAREPAPWRPGVGAPLARLGLPAGARVLEIGAAGGRTHADAAALGLRITGLDVARAALPSGSVQADAAALPFRDGAFDAALLVHVLGHLDASERAAAVAEARRVVRDGGGLLAVALGTGDVRAAKGREVAPGTRERGGLPTHHFTEVEWRALFPDLDVETVRARLRWGTRESLLAWRAARPVVPLSRSPKGI